MKRATTTNQREAPTEGHLLTTLMRCPSCGEPLLRVNLAIGTETATRDCCKMLGGCGRRWTITTRPLQTFHWDITIEEDGHS